MTGGISSGVQVGVTFCFPNYCYSAEVSKETGGEREREREGERDSAEGVVFI